MIFLICESNFLRHGSWAASQLLSLWQDLSKWGHSLKTGLRNLQGTVDITRPRDA